MEVRLVRVESMYVVEARVVVEVVDAEDSVLPMLVANPSDGESRPILFQTPSLNHMGGVRFLSVVIPHGPPLEILENSMNVFVPGVYRPILFVPCSVNHI